MDWDLAIKRNSEALKGILRSCSPCWGLMAPVRLYGIRGPCTVPCWVCCGPQGAVRRLIVVAARNVVVKLAPSRPMPKEVKSSERAAGHSPSFQLFDPFKRFQTHPGCEIPSASTAHSFHRIRTPVCALFPHPGPSLKIPATARWPGRRRAPSPQAPGPQARPSRIYRAKRDDWCACSRGGKPCHGRSPPCRSGPAMGRRRPEAHPRGR